jgi:hypothetical protein
MVMLYIHRFRNPAKLAAVVAASLILAATFGTQALMAQDPQAQGYPGQYPPNRPVPIASQCQSALADRVSADARRRVTLNLDTQNPYSPGNGRQGLRGRLRYGLGGPNNMRTATYDCVVNMRSNRVERVTYNPPAPSTGWPGGPGPGYPGGPGIPGGPGGPVGNYPRVKTDTSLRGNFNGPAFGSVRITRGYVDSRGSRPSVTLRGGDFRITFYGVVQQSIGDGFTMAITGSDRGQAQGSVQVRLNRDRNEIELINADGRLGRSSFNGSFSR